MKTINILMEEHQVILSKLSQLGVELKNDDFTVDKIKYYLDFVHLYVDKYHHDKEENILFPWMLKNNPALEFGPLKCMLGEHDKGRVLIQHALRIVNESNIQDNTVRDHLKETLTEFIDLLSAHIEKEDSILYKMAEAIDKEIQSGDNDMLKSINLISTSLNDQVAIFS